MSHVIHVNASCHIYEWVMSYTWMSYATHMNKSCHIHEWVMSHTWLSHVTHMNESCHTHECVMPHIWMSHVTGWSWHEPRTMQTQSWLSTRRRPRSHWCVCVLLCVAVCCTMGFVQSWLCCRVLQRVAACCSELQYVCVQLWLTTVPWSHWRVFVLGRIGVGGGGLCS